LLINGGDIMNIGFIGAGKVGVSLGKYFKTNGLELSGYYSRSLSSTKEACEFTASKPYDNLLSLIKDSKIIFITTPDDSLVSLWSIIKKYDIKNKIFCHTSGSLSSKIFSDINNSGAFGYSIHPIFAFSDKYTCYKNLKTAYFSIEGDKEYLYDLKNIFDSLGNKIFIIDSDKKPLYHLASVCASNLVLSLINIGCNNLIECGIDEKNALKALMPLIENNIMNLKTKGFHSALTGPIERGDLGTVKSHIDVMPLEQIELYKALSLNLIKLSLEKHENRDYSILEQYLGGV